MPTIDVKKLGTFLGKGLVSEFAPDILSGTLVELFRAKRVNVAKATEWVQANNSLWDSLEPKHQGQLKRLAQKLGNLDFVTTEWAIDSLRSDFPALASLFLGWKRGYNWLQRQLEVIKKRIKE